MKTAKIDRPCPTEAEEQETLMRWADWAAAQHPELAMLHHVPNGGSRHPKIEQMENMTRWYRHLETEAVAADREAAQQADKQLTMGEEAAK